MTDQQKGKTLRTWAFDHCIALMILGMIIVFGTLFTYLWITHDYANSIIKFRDEIREHNKMVNERNALLRVSDDCITLQNAILNSLSRGNNAESWFPNDSEKDLKIGQERYEILGCNK